MKKWLLLILFLVKVKVPFGADLTYHAVKDAQLNTAGTIWVITLSDDRKAYLPAMWTTIEEEKPGQKEETK